MKKFLSVLLALIMTVTCLSVGASADSLRKLDLAFVIDTTGSMDDDIYRVKQDMKKYLEDLEDSGLDYRVAIVDYRDFYENTGDPGDYPYCVQLDFSNDSDSIELAINNLYAYGGGDWEETICSALIDGLSELTWRKEAGKAAILMGDAPAHDPEPITGYTKDMAINKLVNDDIGYEEEVESFKTKSAGTYAVYSKGNRSPVTLFSISTSTSSSTLACFEYLSESTGGNSYVANGSDEISGIIEEIIDVIPEVVEDNELTFWEKIVRFFQVIWYIITFQWDKI